MAACFTPLLLGCMFLPLSLLSAANVKAGVWAYFCYEDTASMDGSSPKGYYSSECWKQQSLARSPMAQGTMMMVKWRHVEPMDGHFTWELLDANVSKAAK